MSNTTIVGSVKFSKLDDYLNKIEQIAFELTDESVNTFNNAFSGNTHMCVSSSSHKNNHDKDIFDDLPHIKIVKDPETGMYVFVTDESDHDLKWVSPDGLFSFMLLDNKYFRATMHGMDELFIVSFKGYDSSAPCSFISALIYLGISNILINLDK